ncbi:hypothetical protein WA1_47635 [Scytonema hofmannii PCC 7110]|uniref:Uncharacterized protein n=1 Tax=Scytonema hofmannii PCC 7110 TaxID=128403 RepID=A0A139WXX6_9CYAN|nr:hypothetical protein [Scytonema hofmannii]KYC37294.1 hypothetical protein WA1_47635 [Scytonema hofmannii PCC 7110]
MKLVFSFAIATLLASVPYAQVTAQTAMSSSRNIKALQLDESSVKVVKREVTPGLVTFTRQNGCVLQNPISTNFLNDGTILETPIRLTASTNSIPEWRNESRKPWQSQLTDYEGGERKMMLLQIGRHPSTPIAVEESSEKLLDSQTICTIAAYKIFGSNNRLLAPIPTQKQNRLSLPLEQGWEKHFNY